MADEWGTIANYILDTETTVKSFNYIKNQEFDLQKIKDLMNVNTGINSFDLYVLKMFIEKYKIKRVLELGCGSSSIFFDKLKIKRKTYAQSSQEYDVKYIQCNVQEEFEKIIKAASSVDLIFIDAEHSRSFAEEYYNKLLLTTDVPVFIHDWFLPQETTYGEQSALLELGILDRYKFQIITRVLCKQLYDNSNIIPCSILLKREQ